MIEQTGTAIRVEQTVPAGADALFAVLCDPRRHVGIDGSGTIRAAAGTEVITAVGQVFTMEMTYHSLGDYRTENHVVEFEPDRLITWVTAREGLRPAGVHWSWALEPQADGGTTVTHLYDWSRVRDPAVLARVSFPRVPAAKLAETVDRLARAVCAAPAG